MVYTRYGFVPLSGRYNVDMGKNGIIEVDGKRVTSAAQGDVQSITPTSGFQ
ncbi:MAG: hypothetical protein RBS49_07135 [Sphaerochaeta sp.]|jgi:hypothetical protein|nr:hypothetical protein [Sphaerochaeta sp.]MDX9915652.1 hypothetical protein [Sphaerochaeta sp.]